MAKLEKMEWKRKKIFYRGELFFEEEYLEEKKNSIKLLINQILNLKLLI